MELQIPHRIRNGIFNHTLLCEFHQGKLLLHLTIPFEEKPKTNLQSDNLKYYRQRKQMTLFPHLWGIDETARRRVKQIMTELLERNPAPDKSTQQLAWVQHMSSLKAQAEEIVNAELIFC